MKRFTSATQKIGRIGEDIAVSYLLRKGFSIVERNYTRRCGEIDVVAVKHGVIHFVEVKSISERRRDGISRETSEKRWGAHRPEDQMHRAKARRSRRIIREFLAERGVGRWVSDVLCVYIDFERRAARVRFIEDQIF